MEWKIEYGFLLLERKFKCKSQIMQNRIIIANNATVEERNEFSDMDKTLLLVFIYEMSKYHLHQ